MKENEKNKKFRNGFEYPASYFENFSKKLKLESPSVANDFLFPFLNELIKCPDEFTTEPIVPSDENFFQTDAFEKKINTGQKISFSLPDENYFESIHCRVKTSIYNFEELNAFPRLQELFRKQNGFVLNADYFERLCQRFNDRRWVVLEMGRKTEKIKFSFGRISIAATMLFIVVGISLSVFYFRKEEANTSSCIELSCISSEEAINGLSQVELEWDELHNLYSNFSEEVEAIYSNEEMDELTEVELNEDI